MDQIDIEDFIKAGLTYDEAKGVIEAEEEFTKNGIGFTHKEVKKLARTKLLLHGNAGV